jgi:hypothetical protein
LEEAMANVLLIVGCKFSGSDVPKNKRFTIFNKVEIDMGKSAALSHAAWQKIAFAAKMEYLKQLERSER